jgi:hypothetical protein
VVAAGTKAESNLSVWGKGVVRATVRIEPRDAEEALREVSDYHDLAVGLHGEVFAVSPRQHRAPTPEAPVGRAVGVVPQQDLDAAVRPLGYGACRHHLAIRLEGHPIRCANPYRDETTRPKVGIDSAIRVESSQPPHGGARSAR